MNQKKKTTLTKQAWLHELGRRLAWSFPTAQVRDILSDYQEQFEAGLGHGKTEAEIIQALGAPAEAAALLLEEEPAARSNRLRQNVLWGAALALCLMFWWICFANPSSGLFWVGTLIFHPAAMAVLFMLLRGPCRVVLDQQHISRTLPYYLPAGLALVGLLEKLLLPQYSMYLYRQYSASKIAEEAFQQANRVLRYGNALFWLMLMASAALLAVWLLVQSMKNSIRYFPGVIHSAGALESIFFTAAYFGAMNADFQWQRIIGISMSLLPYFAGLITALVFQRWADGRKPLPRVFQGGAVTWQDWRHRLGVSLLGWFDAEQTVEIMSDYQEQYELGREQGKNEESILLEMGYPETIVRDLLAEDRKARLNRRKSWPWAVMAAAAGWLLLGLLRTFEFGGTGLGWFYEQNTLQIGIFSIILGTIALFILLHAWKRAVVERQFPAPPAHTAWIYLPPLLFSALAEGEAFWLIYSAYSPEGIPLILGQPLTIYIILTIEFSILLLILLLIWTLARCISGPILHFPAVPSIAGGIASVLCAGKYLTSMDASYIGEDLPGTIRIFLTSLYPCLTGLLMAVVSWLVLRTAGRKEG